GREHSPPAHGPRGESDVSRAAAASPRDHLGGLRAPGSAVREAGAGTAAGTDSEPFAGVPGVVEWTYPGPTAVERAGPLRRAHRLGRSDLPIRFDDLCG